MIKRSEILNVAFEEGFDLCGVTRAMSLDEERNIFLEWLRHGRNGGLDYLERNMEKRFDASLLIEGALSIVVCALNYKNEYSCGYPDGYDVPKIASYALYEDYHYTIRAMLRHMAEVLGFEERKMVWRVFSDSAPVAEKSLAVRAGLGCIGRNSLLLTPQFGSFVLLGELIFTEEVDVYDAPFTDDLCGGCHLCMEKCPNHAIGNDKTIDASCCISRLTIEPLHETVHSKELHGWIFGCDECQSRCPRNRTTPLASSHMLKRCLDPLGMEKEFWCRLDDKSFDGLFGKTPLMRSGLNRLKNNL